ncbi:hypothetical protein EDD18DRAFT_1162313 [Armillaria luteobubalina]|uniref:Uncharacterized protein n=1 Tax=Armillaria luteobubalina TaxID=153913 RepID=A0AA39Q7K3_9AGAR|nr:hypothetical protein EDD18DRAFT_1162313 [Armillaria luteobubalina]
MNQIPMMTMRNRNQGDAGDNEDVEGCNSMSCTRRERVWSNRTRQLPVGSQRSLRGPSENGDRPSTTTVSNIPHLAGIEEGPVSSSANQSFLGDEPHAPKPVGPNAPLIIPWVPTRQRSRCGLTSSSSPCVPQRINLASPSRELGGRRNDPCWTARRIAFILATRCRTRERETIHTFSQLRSQRRRRCGYASLSSLNSSDLHRCPRWRGSDSTGSIGDLSQCWSSPR